MCGIMGYYSFGSKLPEKQKIANMFSLLDTRGRDASGYAFIDKNNLVVHKAAIKSSEMVKTKEWLKLELPRVMIFHCRMKTQGTEKNNANNHPIFTKNGLALVHNGIIFNDEEIFGKKQRDAEVDSEAILSLLSMKSRGDKIKRLFERIEGSFAIALIDKNDPEKLILIKKDNPIDFYFYSDDDILYFCSEREIIRQALNIQSISLRGFNIGEDNYHNYEMQNNHCLLVNRDGVESYQRYYPRRDRWYYQDLYDNEYEEEIIIECPWCFYRTRYCEGKLFNKCEECGMSINEEDLYNVI